MEAMVEFLEVFASEFIGPARINYGAIMTYLQSGKSQWFLLPDIDSIDDVMELIEKWVLTGAPIWNFLHLENDFQRQMFEGLSVAYQENQARLAEEQRLADLKLYKCLTCIHFEISTAKGKRLKRIGPGCLEPGDYIFGRRCQYLECREPDGLERDDPEYWNERDRRETMIRQKMKYSPGSFNVYDEANKAGCDGYKYDKERDQ
jgi:hypothetical protein